MGSTGLHQTTLNRVKLQASVDEGTADSLKLLDAATAIKNAADALQHIAVDVGWTGASAENSAETFNALGGKLQAHGLNIDALAAVASDAEDLVTQGRGYAEDVAGILDTADFFQPMVDAVLPVQELRDADALKKLQEIDAAAAALQVRAVTINLTAQENRVDPDALLPEPVPVPGPEEDDDRGAGPTRPGYGGGGIGTAGDPAPGRQGTAPAPISSGLVSNGPGRLGGGEVFGPSGPGGAGGSGGTGVGGGYPSSHGGPTSVDGATGGYVNGGSGYGSLDRGGASAFGASAGMGSTGSGGAGSPGGPGLGAGAMGAGAAGLLGGARSGAFGGGAGGLGRLGGPAAQIATGGGVSGSTTGARAGGAGAPAATSAGSRPGTQGAMMGGGGAGGAGGSSKKGKRSSAGYLAPRLDDDPSAPGRVDAMRAGSRADLAARPSPPPVDEPDDDRW